MTTVPKRRFVIFCISSTAYVAVLFVASELLPTLSTHEAIVISVTISIPIMASWAYHAAVRKRIWVEGVFKNETSRMYAFLTSGFLFRILLAIFIAIWTSTYFVIEITYTSKGIAWYFWVAAIASIPLMYLCHQRISKAKNFRSEIKDFITGFYSSIGAAAIVALLLTIFLSEVTNYGPEEQKCYNSVEHALEDQVTYFGTNSVINLFIDLYRIANATSDWAWCVLRTASFPKAIYGVVYFLNIFIVCLGLTSAIAIFLISPKETVYCIFPSKNGRSGVTIKCIVTVALLCIFIYLLFSGMEPTAERIRGTAVRLNTEARIDDLKERHRAQLQVIEEDVQDVQERSLDIDGRVQRIKARARDMKASSYEQIESDTREYFDRVRENVHEFLDWYYSLRASPKRYAALVFGNVIQNKMMQTLFEGVPILHPDAELETLNAELTTLNATLAMLRAEYATLEAELTALNNVIIGLNDQFNRDVEQVISIRSIEPPEGVELRIIRSVTGSDIQEYLEFNTIPLDDILIDPEQFSIPLARPVIGFGAGGVAAFAGGRMTKEAIEAATTWVKGAADRAAKGATKNLAKKTAQSVTVQIVRKFTAVAVRAVAGAVGSAAGPVGVVVAMLVVELVVELISLEIEERMERPQIEATIMSAIDEAERGVLGEFQASILGDE